MDSMTIWQTYNLLKQFMTKRQCRSPDSVAATKELFNATWVSDDETCLKKETTLQLKLIKTYNQIAASGRQFGVSLPYFRRQDWDIR